MDCPIRPRRRAHAIRGVLALGVAFVQLACAGSASLPGPVEPSTRASQVAVSGRGMVASAAPLATEVGAEVLERGGNAVDAAVATAFALAVVEPAMSGLGGRTSIVIRRADGSLYGIDGLNQVPHGYAEGAPAGYDRAAIPGTPAALGRALAEHGTWSLAAVLEPAIELAERGFRVLPGDAERMAGAHEDLMLHEASRRYFLRPDGTPLQGGDVLVQQDLARALKAMATDGVDVYEGWIADSIHVDMTERGGFVTREELAGYEALDAVPARGSYRGYTLASNFRPSAGHAVIQALHMMEGFDVPPATDPVGWAALVGQAMQIAISDRGRSLGSPEESAQTLTSKAYARERAREIRLPGPGTGAERGAARPLPERRLAEGSWLATDETQTTHMSVADASGMAVALTQSIGPTMGARLAARGVGFLYATRLGSTPGSRPSSTISPTIVLHPDGRFAMAVGGAGDARIISATIQTISRKLDHGIRLGEAVGAPRVHPGDPGELTAEDGDGIGWSADVRDALRALGFEVETASEQYFGRVHAIWFDPVTGEFTGAADPRRDGTAAAPGG